MPTISLTILQDKRTGRFVVVNDASGEHIGDKYATLEEAEQAGRAWSHDEARSRRSAESRVPQHIIDEMLLDEDEMKKPYARLLASEAWPAFETWLDSEDLSTADKTTAVMEAMMRFSAVVISGFAGEHWPDNGRVRMAIQRLAARFLKQMMERR